MPKPKPNVNFVNQNQTFFTSKLSQGQTCHTHTHNLLHVHTPLAQNSLTFGINLYLHLFLLISSTPNTDVTFMHIITIMLLGCTVCHTSCPSVERHHHTTTVKQILLGQSYIDDLLLLIDQVKKKSEMWMMNCA